MSHAFISTVDIRIPSLYRGAKDGETVGIIIENKHINGLEINLESVMFNVCCGFRVGHIYNICRPRATKTFNTLNP